MFKNRSFTIFIAILSTLTIQQVHADTPFFEAVYKGKHLGIPLTITRTLKPTENGYEFKLAARGFPGRIIETSHFYLEESNIIPTTYSYFQKVFGNKRTHDLTFDWINNVATYLKNNEHHSEHTLTQGMLEQSIYQLQLMRDLNNGKTDFNYEFVKRQKIKKQTFKIIDKKTHYKIGKTEYLAWLLEIVRPEGDKTNTQIVVIPELNFHIGRITQIEKDGTKYEVNLKKITINENFVDFLSK